MRIISIYRPMSDTELSKIGFYQQSPFRKTFIWPFMVAPTIQLFVFATPPATNGRDTPREMRNAVIATVDIYRLPGPLLFCWNHLSTRGAAETSHHRLAVMD